MKVSLGFKFLDLDDNVMKDEKGKEMSLADALKMALVAELPSDTEGSGSTPIENKMKNYDIFLKIRDAIKAGEHEVELAAEEIAHIKPRLAKIFATLITAPACRILEGKPPYGNAKTESWPAEAG